MSLHGVILEGSYRSYKSYVFVKDWFLTAAVVTLFMIIGISVVFGGISFTNWGGVQWDYFWLNKYWYARLSLTVGVIGGFLFSFFMFPDSYENELRNLGIKK